MIGARRVLAVVTARGQNRRLPGKNMRPFLGRPLIEWTFDAARACPQIDRLILSTDDADVAEIGRADGVEVPFMRPAELASETAPVVDTLLHAIDAIGGVFDIVVLLQPTSPLRRGEDITACLTRMAETGAPSAVTVGELPKPLAFYCGVEDGKIRRGLFADGGARRPALFNGAVYAIEIEALRRDRALVSNATEAVVMPWTRSIDIDDLDDFAVAEALAGARP